MVESKGWTVFCYLLLLDFDIKGLRVNAGKMKFMICGTVLDLLQSSGKIPCTVCCTGVGSNSIFCIICKHRVHKKCSVLKHLTKDPDLKCTWCQGTAHPFDSRPQGEVQVGPDKCENCLEEVQGAATSSLFPPRLFQDMWPRVQLLCTEHNAPCQ